MMVIESHDLSVVAGGRAVTIGEAYANRDVCLLRAAGASPLKPATWGFPKAAECLDMFRRQMDQAARHRRAAPARRA